MIWRAQYCSSINEKILLKKAKINAVGVVGLVENMVSVMLKD